MTFKTPDGQTRKPAVVIPFAQLKREPPIAEIMKLVPPGGRCGELISLGSYRNRKRERGEKEQQPGYTRAMDIELLRGYAELIDGNHPAHRWMGI